MDAASYGIEFSGEDRYWYLRTEWSEVVIELGDVEVTVGLTPSFWVVLGLRSAVMDGGCSRPVAHRGTAANGIVVHPLKATDSLRAC
jgi:hypothetical protein